MADIFVSYSRVDVKRAEAIAKALESHGWTVWWDLHKLRTGQSFSKAIENPLGQAKCVIVLWSRASVNSRWVKAEAKRGWDHDKLASVLLDEALPRPPFPYDDSHAGDLSGWTGDTKTPEWRKLIADLTEIVGPPSSARAQATGIEIPIQPAEAPFTVAAVPRTTSFALPEPEMVRIEPGTFLMGSAKRSGFLGMFKGEGSSDEWPQHEVRIVRAFGMGRYPVTFEEYDAFAKATKRDPPGDNGWGRGRRPVVNVSWEDAVVYAQWLSERTGKRYRLPTEAEWEYAARAGTTSAWSCGNRERDLHRHVWDFFNSGEQTHPVGEKAPNPWGLYDVHGNVWEWVQDCWHANYEGAPTDGSSWQDEAGGKCGRRVLRGGSWNYKPVLLRSATRGWNHADTRHDAIGCRLAQDL